MCSLFLLLCLSIAAMVMKDLTFFNDGNKTRVDGMVNVDKLRKMAARALNIRALGLTTYTEFADDPVLRNYVSQLRGLPMDRMVALSETLEPRQ